jgi:NAD(P)-dependent dehydrogenase (short-subunit alcohol dehydrogenase family)
VRTTTIKFGGKRILVTGIRFAIAKAFLAKDARVVIAGRRSTAVEELRETGGGVTGSPRMSARRRGALRPCIVRSLS